MSQLTIVLADLASARAEAAHRLSAMRDAEHAAREARDAFERARRVVQRHSKRHNRLINQKGTN